MPSRSGFVKTLFNSVNILCGVGLLATPYAAAEMGWASLLLLAILGKHACTPCLKDLKTVQHKTECGTRGSFARLLRGCNPAVSLVCSIDVYC